MIHRPDSHARRTDDYATLELAIDGILARLGEPRPKDMVVICSESKAGLGQALYAYGLSAGMGAHLLELPHTKPATMLSRAALFVRACEEAPESAGLAVVLLIDPLHASWLFKTVGRPDRGIRLANTRFYCDWLLPLPVLLRTVAADYAEQVAWRRRLMGWLLGTSQVRLTTRAGTDLDIPVGRWLAMDDEVCAPVLGDRARGTLVIDGSVYTGPPANPISLSIADGRVQNLGTLDASQPRERIMLDDLTRDGAASCLAEIGLGINTRALPDGEIMEAEMSRGTVHLGFGENRSLGGALASATHLDFGLLHPTLWLDGQLLCRDGRYPF